MLVVGGCAKAGAPSPVNAAAGGLEIVDLDQRDTAVVSDSALHEGVIGRGLRLRVQLDRAGPGGESGGYSLNNIRWDVGDSAVKGSHIGNDWGGLIPLTPGDLDDADVLFFYWLGGTYEVRVSADISHGAGSKPVRAHATATYDIGGPRYPPNATTEGEGAWPNGKDVRAQIEVQRSSYRLRDTVRVRIALTNTSNLDIYRVPLAAADLVHLVITRNGKPVDPPALPAGNAVAPPADGAAGPTADPRLPWVTMKPHVTTLLDRGRWLPLGTFGYRLREPGRYTIQGIPRIMGAPLFRDTTTVRSNTATFTIGK
jgi:hypothetical protein